MGEFDATGILAEPQEPDSPKARLIRLAAARSSYLQQPFNGQQGMSVEQADGEALRQIRALMRMPAYRQDIASWVKSGVKTGWYYGFTREPDPSDPRNPEYYRDLQQHSFLRDWIAEPLLRIPVAGAQGLVNLGAGVANLFGAGVTAPEMESAARASARFFFGGENKSIEQLRAEEAARLTAYEESRSLGAKIVQGAGTTVGAVAGLRFNPALAVGGSAGQWIANVAFRIGENPTAMQKLAQLAARGAGAFGLLSGLEAKPGEPPPAMNQRIRNALIGAVTGPLYELTGAAGKASFMALMRGAGRDGRELTKTVADWARTAGIARAEGEAPEAFYRRTLNAWIDAGTPGLRGLGINTRKAAALGAQALVDAAGFSAIDGHFREDLVAAWLGQDQDAWGRVASDFASNALGMWFIHAGGRLADIPRLQRQQRLRTEIGTAVALRRFGWELAEDGRYVLAGSEMGFDLADGTVRPNGPLRAVLGAPESLPAGDFLGRLEKASLASALHSKTNLPGHEVSTEGIYGDGDKLRTIRLGEVLERDAKPGSDWQPALGVPARSSDDVPKRQRELADDLERIAQGRQDLAGEDRALVASVASVLRRVSGERDPSVVDAVRSVPGELENLRTGDAAAAIKRLAEVLTVKSPEVIREEHLAEEEPPSQSEAPPPAPAEPAPTNSVYHGAASAIDRLNETYYSGQNIYGEGFYTTDSRTVAKSYTNKNAAGAPSGGKPTVYRVAEKQPVRFFDLDAPLTSAVRSLIDPVGDSSPSIGEALDSPDVATLGQLMDRARAIATDNRESADTITAAFDRIREDLEQLGYGGYTHVGGKLRGSESHRVRIYWHPEQQIELAEPAPTERKKVTLGEATAPPAEGAAREAEAPPPGGIAEVGGGLIPPEIGRAVADVAKSTGQAGGGILRQLVDDYERGMIRVAEDAGTPPDVVERMKHGDTLGRQFAGRFRAAGLPEYERLTRASVTGARSRVVAELERFIDAGNGAMTTVFAAKLDEKLGKHTKAGSIRISPEAQKIVDLAHRLIVEPAKVAAENGIEFVNAPGGLTGSESLYRLPRKFTDEAKRGLQDPRSPVRDAVSSWLQATYGWDPNEVDARLGLQETLVRHDAVEYRRTLNVLPSRVQLANGELFKLYEDRVTAVHDILESAARVLGARVVFRTPPADVEALTAAEKLEVGDVPEGAQTALLRVLRESGREAAEAAKRAIKALHGLPIDDRQTFLQRLPAGSPAQNLLRGLFATMNVMKAGRLTLAFINNTLSLGQHIAHIGPLRFSLALRDISRDALEGNIGSEIERLAGEGYFRVDIRDRRIKGESAVETFENATRRISDTIVKPLEATQSFLQLHLAKSAELALADMRAGRGSEADKTLLTAMGFARERIDAMLAGHGTSDEYQYYKTHVVSQLEAGSSQTSTEKSLAQHRNFDFWIWFQGFYRKRVSALRGYFAEMADARTNAERGLVAGKLVSFLALNSVAGFATQIVRKWLKGETMADWWREATTNPADSLATVLLSGLFGVPGELLHQAFKGLFTGQPGIETVGDFADTIGPIGSAGRSLNFIAALLGADRPGYENMTPLEKVAKYVRREVPALTAAHRGLFGIAAIALTDESPRLHNARDAYYRWARDNGMLDTPDARDPERIRWLDAMRSVMDRVEADDQWGDAKLMDAIEKAEVFGQTKQSIGESLRSRKVFKGPLDERSKSYDAEKAASLLRYLGAKNVAILEAWDDTLEYLAARWNRAHGIGRR